MISFGKMNPYHSKRWEQKRALILRRDKYRCQYYSRLGRNVPANTVHHIFPLKEFPEYQWENWNLISLSNEAHEKMHLRNYDTLSDEGIELLKRTARKNGIPVPLRYE